MSSFSVVLLILATIFQIQNSAASSEKIPDCPPNQFPTIYFPHETSCVLYYSCAYGELTLQRCPVGLEFKPEKSECDWPTPDGCLATWTTPVSTVTSSDFVDTIFKSKTSYPNTTANWTTSYPNTTVEWTTPYPNTTANWTTSYPNTTVEWTTPYPNTTANWTTSYPNTTVEWTTPYPNTTANWTTSYPNTTVEWTTPYPNTTANWTTSYPNMTVEWTTPYPNTTANWTTSYPNTTVEWTTPYPNTTANWTTSYPNTTVEWTTPYPNTTANWTTSYPNTTVEWTTPYPNTTTTTESSNNKTCPNADPIITIIAHPDYCDKFYVCFSGDATEFVCMNGSEFDPSVNGCVPISDSGCFASKPSFKECPSSECSASYWPHPTNCTKYYLCFCGFPVELNCNHGLEFDPITMECVPSQTGSACSASRL